MPASWSSTEEGISAYLVLFMALLAIVLVLSQLLHDRPVVASLLPEAGMILLVGMVFGSIMTLFAGSEPLGATEDENGENDNVAQGLLSFSPEVFFVFLLPPIIFNSGYHLRRELFFRHITPIALLAVLGTTVSALTIAMLLKTVVAMGWTGSFQPFFTELLTFGALISATDPVSTLAVFQAKRVDPHLFYLVFGESVLNDAVGLVLFKSFVNFVHHDNGAGKIVMGMGEFIVRFLMDSLGSPILGIVCGCASAYLFKVVDLRRNRLIELSVYILIMYAPFLLAELCKVSGIVTILFTGMTARTYVVPNLTPITADHAEVFFRLAAHLAETSIFLELGLSVMGLMSRNFYPAFIAWSLVACLFGRALNVYPIVFFFNKWLREKPHDLMEQEEMKHYDHHRHHQQHHQPRMGHVEMINDGYHPHRDDNREQPFTISPPHSASAAELAAASTTAMSPPSFDEQSVQTETPQFRKDLKIPPSTAHMLWFAGLRGAVAYACVRSFPNTLGHQKEFVATTMAIILLTVFIMGASTELVMNYLQIEMNVDEDRYMENWHRERRSATLILQFESYLRSHVVRDHDEDDANGSSVMNRRRRRDGKNHGAMNGNDDDDDVDCTASGKTGGSSSARFCQLSDSPLPNADTTVSTTATVNFPVTLYSVPVPDIPQSIRSTTTVRGGGGVHCGTGITNTGNSKNRSSLFDYGGGSQE